MSLRNVVKHELFDRLFHRRRLYVLNFHKIRAPNDGVAEEFGTETALAAFSDTIDQVGARYPIVDLYDWVQNPRSGHSVAITFDDGHSSVAELAAPLLHARGISATLFLNSGYWSEGRRVCWSDAEGEGMVRIGDSEVELNAAVRTARTTVDPKIYREWVAAIEAHIADRQELGHGYLRESDLAELNPNVIRIGLHGHLHHRHAMFDRDWQAANILQNLQALQERRGFVPVCALPFGTSIDVDANSMAACRDAGVIPAFHAGGYMLPGEGIIRRIPADGRDACSIINGQSPFLQKYDVL